MDGKVALTAAIPSPLSTFLLAILACGGILQPAAPLAAAESISTSRSASSSDYLAQIPADAKHMAPVLRHMVGVVQSAIEVQEAVTSLRTEQDTVKTKLAAITSELELITKHQQQLTQQLSAAESQAKQRFHTLREELEEKLARELADTRDQLTAQRELDYERELGLFETRQRDVIGKALDEELDLKSRELQQLSEEIDVQTQELTDRLARLEGSPEIAKSLERQTQQILAKRRAELEARRSRIASERAELLDRHRAEFIQQMNAKFSVESDRRLKVKEASLRSSMAELLKKAERDEAGKVERLRDAAEEARQRHSRVMQQQALLSTRADVIQAELTAKTQLQQKLDGERTRAVIQFEEAFAPMLLEPESLAWLGRTIRYMPPGVAAELIPLQQRLVASAEQEQRLRQQKRLVYERQMAVQLSREMEEKRREVERQQKQEQLVRSKRAKELLDKARDLGKQGRFDEAIELLVQAQGLNPPDLSQIALAREQFVTAKQQRAQDAQRAQIEGLFNQAMASFERGEYEQAVALFEQVIEQEGRSQDTMTLMGGRAR